MFGVSAKRTYIEICTLTILLAMMLSAPALAEGLLRVHPENSRYFTDDSGQAIYLAGHQSFVDVQDNSFNKEFIRGRQRTLVPMQV